MAHGARVIQLLSAFAGAGTNDVTEFDIIRPQLLHGNGVVYYQVSNTGNGTATIWGRMEPDAPWAVIVDNIRFSGIHAVPFCPPEVGVSVRGNTGVFNIWIQT